MGRKNRLFCHEAVDPLHERIVKGVPHLRLPVDSHPREPAGLTDIGLEVRKLGPPDAAGMALIEGFHPGDERALNMAARLGLSTCSQS